MRPADTRPTGNSHIVGPPPRRIARALAPRGRASVRRRTARIFEVEALEGRVVLSTITVTGLGDSGTGTLRAAIEQANLDAAPDTIAFDPSVVGTITLTSVLPDLSNIAINGPGASVLTVARSNAAGTPEFRVFNVPVGADVAISGLTVTGGLTNFGGGISNAGTLTISNSTFSGNTAHFTDEGGGISNSGVLTISHSTSSGNMNGGIANLSGTLTISDSTVSGNGGDGIANLADTVTISNSTIRENVGSGIFNQAGMLTISNSTIRGNTGNGGGGIDNGYYGTVAVTSSTISGNMVSSAGGGISNSGTMTISASTISGNTASVHDGVVYGGGGIFNSGALTISTSTISGNKAGFGSGGGIANFSPSGVLTISTSTISGNTASVGPGGGISNPSGTLTISDSTIGGNTAVDGGGIDGAVTLTGSILQNAPNNVVGVLASRGHNLFSDNPSSGVAPTDLINTDPLLGPLANNGGATFTQALLPGSPAIDTGVALTGVTTDQRGIARPQGLAPDIGAFELDRADHPFVQLLAAPSPALVGTSQTITATVFDTNLQRLAGVPVTFRISTGPNAGATGVLDPTTGLTDAAGQTRFTYTGAGGVGTDTFVATATLPGGVMVDSPSSSLEWGSLTVTTTADSGLGSLRSAIELANLSAGPDTIRFAPSVTGTITLATALPDLSSAIDIEGPGSATLTVTRSAIPMTPTFRIFTVPAGAVVTIAGLTITGGRADEGGGILNAGTLTVTASMLTGNSAGFGGFSSEGSGGAIANSGTLTISSSTLSGNSAYGTLFIPRFNPPYVDGGLGGAIANSGTLTISNSTLSGNKVVSDHNGQGGGIFNTGTLTVTASSLAGNAANSGGAILNSIGHSTLTDSILAGGAGGTLVNVGGAITSHGHNLFSDAPGVSLDPTDLINTDPRLGPLADNGGPTQTLALLTGSPAIDAGILVPGVTTDQRGVPRPFGAAADIGAFEYRVFTVTTIADAGPGSLRYAIAQANLDPIADAIAFDPSVVGTITLTSALPDLSNVTINGPGASALTVARSGAAGTPQFRIFNVPSGAEVTIAGLTVAGGRADSGGGILNLGTLTITACTLSQNGATDGGAIYNTGTVTVSASTIENNNASFFDLSFPPTVTGGGIVNSGTMTISTSTISGNRASSAGQLQPGTGYGGGIDNSGAMLISFSTISNNLAEGTGGKIGGFANGGGIGNSGTLTIVASTVSGNSLHFGLSPGQGSGIYNTGTLAVTTSSVAGNTTNSVYVIYNLLSANGGGSPFRGRSTLTDSIFAGGAGSTVGNVLGTVTSMGHNLFSDAPIELHFDPTDLINTDPLLGPLASNGGPTQTMALLPGSPAIDAGVAVDGVTTDQRGIARPQGSAPDIGAFESRGFTLTVSAGDGQAAQIGSSFPAPLTVAVTSPFGEPVAGGRVTFTVPTSGPSAVLDRTVVSLDANGRGSVNATANGVAGTYSVTAGIPGAKGVAWKLTNATMTPNEAIPPTVVNLQRTGFHDRPTRIVLTFSRALDPARASNRRNYVLVRVGPRGRAGSHPHFIPIKSIAYDPARLAVTISPRHLLPLHNYYRLTVHGKAPDGVAAIDGTLLDGAGTGQPGSNYVAVIHGLAHATKAASRPRHAGPLRAVTANGSR